MNAYVIDQKQLKRYVVEIVVALVIAFTLGFVLGMQQTKVDNEIAQSNLEKSTAQKTTDSAETKQPLVSGKASETDVKDQALTSAEKIRLAKEKTAHEKIALKEQEKIAQEKLALKKLAEKKLAKQKLEKEKLAKQKLAREKLAQEKLAREKIAREKIAREQLAKEKQAKAELEKKKQQASKPGETTSQANNTTGAATEVDEAQSTKRVFSIQAGMFASKSNAESFIEKLEAKQFKAYVSDFQSSSGATKYNVRVGRFDDREKARELLNEFQKSFSSPAYVVIAQ